MTEQENEKQSDQEAAEISVEISGDISEDQPTKDSLDEETSFVEVKWTKKRKIAVIVAAIRKFSLKNIVRTF